MAASDRPKPSDHELVERVRAAPQGDLRSFETLVSRHQESVVANCRYVSGSPADAEDLAQEVFVKAFFGLRRFEGRATFRTWIRRIKVNHCLNFRKRRKGPEHIDLTHPGARQSDGMRVAPAGERRMASQDRRDRIRETLEGIPDTLRVPLVLRDMDGLSYQEIAEQLGIGLSAAKMRVKRGREAFRTRYSDGGTEADGRRRRGEEEAAT